MGFVGPRESDGEVEASGSDYARVERGSVGECAVAVACSGRQPRWLGLLRPSISTIIALLSTTCPLKALQERCTYAATPGSGFTEGMAGGADS